MSKSGSSFLLAFFLLLTTHITFTESDKEKALILFSEKKYAPAVESFRKLLQEFPDDLSALYNLASSLEANGNYRLAVAEWSRCAKLYPDSPWAKLANERISKLVSSGKVSIQPVEISEISINPIFSSMYKYYSNNPIGKITLASFGDTICHNVKTSIFIKEYMDFPAESSVITQFPVYSEKELYLYAGFNNSILSISEDAPGQAEITVSYFHGNKKEEVKTVQKVTILNRNALTWNDSSKLSAFITPKDPVVMGFAKAVMEKTSKRRYPFLNDNLKKAIFVFGSLSASGISYVSDPKTPFVKYYNQPDEIDYVQYPRQTLQFKTGDCDDCAVLFCSLLESVGVSTGYVCVSGHIFAIFDSGMDIYDFQNLFPDRLKLVAEDGCVWIPVETTMYGRTFFEAWDESAKTFSQNDRENVEMIRTDEAWTDFPPSTLKDITWEPATPSHDAISVFADSDVRRFNREIHANISSQFGSAVSGQTANESSINKLGTALFRAGLYPEAEAELIKLLEINPNNANYHNNLANVYRIQGKYEEAVIEYKNALSLNPLNRGIIKNLLDSYILRNKR